MANSEGFWPQRTRYQESSRTRTNRISLLSTYSSSEEPSHSISPQINKTLSKLIDRFDLNYDHQTPQEIQRNKERLLDKYNRMISSHREPSITENENQVVTIIHNKLAQGNRESDKAYRFAHIYNKLSSKVE
ncbi:hypothetical protein BDB01DRAFT_124294 [Pilobolus umbonatus]|nr:hypothetical protein BDB01DRAFT_124294 [Pilobolus umbonatus]